MKPNGNTILTRILKFFISSRTRNRVVAIPLPFFPSKTRNQMAIEIPLRSLRTCQVPSALVGHFVRKRKGGRMQQSRSVITFRAGTYGAEEFPTLVRRRFTIENSRLLNVWEECLLLQNTTEPRDLVIVDSDGFERSRMKSIHDTNIWNVVGIWRDRAIVNTITYGEKPKGVFALDITGRWTLLKGIAFCSSVWGRWLTTFHCDVIELWEWEEGGSIEAEPNVIKRLRITGVALSAIG